MPHKLGVKPLHEGALLALFAELQKRSPEGKLEKEAPREICFVAGGENGHGLRQLPVEIRSHVTHGRRLEVRVRGWHVRRISHRECKFLVERRRVAGS